MKITYLKQNQKTNIKQKYLNYEIHQSASLNLKSSCRGKRIDVSMCRVVQTNSIKQKIIKQKAKILGQLKYLTFRLNSMDQSLVSSFKQSQQVADKTRNEIILVRRKIFDCLCSKMIKQLPKCKNKIKKPVLLDPQVKHQQLEFKKKTSFKTSNDPSTYSSSFIQGPNRYSQLNNEPENIQVQEDCSLIKLQEGNTFYRLNLSFSDIIFTQHCIIDSDQDDQQFNSTNGKSNEKTVQQLSQIFSINQLQSDNLQLKKLTIRQIVEKYALE